MNEKSYLLASAFNIFGYDIIVKDFIENILPIQDGKLFYNGDSQYLYLLKEVQLGNAKSIISNLISSFYNDYDKLNIINLPNIELTIGSAAEEENEISKNNIKALALIKNVSILSENCILYGVNNLISEELFSENDQYREIDKRIFHLKDKPSFIYSLLI
ncbi:hypothetical protein [Leptospira levettii]|uniref:hypothetical protein n=1 Tax=Leptospira levettii TaxID=2023178 RepID=UPI000C2AEF36|nr:hypothetical protein [Leptospira levettii]PKA22716.1 hypothetical protein CH381_29465 [Leptospira sp. mixed culture ATI2-C-A1]TGM23497.1 hypothetical protein EHQ74_18025 [Leptospira levettii]